MTFALPGATRKKNTVHLDWRANEDDRSLSRFGALGGIVSPDDCESEVDGESEVGGELEVVRDGGVSQTLDVPDSDAVNG